MDTHCLTVVMECLVEPFYLPILCQGVWAVCFKSMPSVLHHALKLFIHSLPLSAIRIFTNEPVAQQTFACHIFTHNGASEGECKRNNQLYKVAESQMLHAYFLLYNVAMASGPIRSICTISSLSYGFSTTCFFSISSCACLPRMHDLHVGSW